MAGAKKAARKKAPARPPTASATAAEPTREEIRLKYDPVMVALSKASAARVLLVDAEIDGSEDDLEWINSFAATALYEALDEARAAYIKALGDKAPPATEAAP